jgi:hypothetical protein
MYTYRCFMRKLNEKALFTKAKTDFGLNNISLEKNLLV